ncbi:hypothetical protein BUALT_Bualt19G0113500 [Buddleja alternifolia]|uniref:Suppressor of forked domain-containing protein n=1 Tax=Buddleja alternifolia TaxID=168488 RepID=A0AAV6W9E4_9LAMI|nr:hypothetical protein BUALT_Bualt19G0113500 [Buddleja alternifolia]
MGPQNWPPNHNLINLSAAAINLSRRHPSPPTAAPQLRRSRLPISDAVPIYEQLVAAFPTAAKYWKQYIEAHMAVNNDEATRQIFSRCLLNCLQVPLWRCYIRFIRKVNDKKGMEGQEETKKAFEFMLNYVGKFQL